LSCSASRKRRYEEILEVPERECPSDVVVLVAVESAGVRALVEADGDEQRQRETEQCLHIATGQRAADPASARGRSRLSGDGGARQTRDNEQREHHLARPVVVAVHVADSTADLS
jgi:hypothetical protein